MNLCLKEVLDGKRDWKLPLLKGKSKPLVGSNFHAKWVPGLATEEVGYWFRSITNRDVSRHPIYCRVPSNSSCLEVGAQSIFAQISKLSVISDNKAKPVCENSRIRLGEARVVQYSPPILTQVFASSLLILRKLGLGKERQRWWGQICSYQSWRIRPPQPGNFSFNCARRCHYIHMVTCIL